MIKSDFSLENKLLEKGHNLIVGIDEAGRGPLAGPVVAAAVCLKALDELNFGHPMSKEWDLIRDSKTLTVKQREKAFDFVTENFHLGVGIVNQETIDRVNILEASFLAMKAALSDLERSDFDRFKGGPLRKIILVDGNKKIPNLSIEQRAIVNGDKVVKSISAASIVAKVTRDRMMMEMHEKYPQYQFDKHKGYGTKLHMEMLQKHGPCECHRKGFEPVSRLLSKS